MLWHRPLTLAFTCAPLWVTAFAVPPVPRDDNYVSTTASPSHPEALQSQVQVSCQAQAADDALNLDFEVAGSWDSDFCGNSELLVNGRPLEQDWWQQDSDWASSSVLSVDVQRSHSTTNHSLVLEASSTCIRSDSNELLHFTAFTVTSIDDTPTDAKCGFFVSYDRHSGQKVMPLPPAPRSDSTSFSSPIKSGSTSSVSIKTSLGQQDAVVAAPALMDEIKRLRTLEADLGELTALVERQRQLIDGLVSEKHTEAFKDCDNVKCYLKTIAHKAKGCVHLMMLRYGPGQEVEAFAKDHDCVWPEGRAARMQVLMSGKPLCLSAPPSQKGAGHLELGDDSSSDSTSDYSAFTTTINNRISKEHRIHLVLGTVLSALCLSCFCVFLHRRCCDPRRRAERAAQREERARRRQYRCLTRRKAWKDWWNMRVMRNTHGASTDYEEKRGLIMSQEAILERAMQDQIRVLRAAHTGVSDMAAAAEEGRAYASDDESLPAYRSRAGSGRPPSYHEYMTVQSSSSSSVRGASLAAAAVTAAALARLDITPDSSVANLSPRHSSETLRTERSVI